MTGVDATPAPAGPEPPVSAPQEAILLEDVHKSFGDLEVLRGIDLSVATHEVICLIGASGSGKSTLLRCVNLLEPINRGRILLWGEDVTAPGRRRERGPALHRHRLPGVQSLPTHDRAPQHHARSHPGARRLP